MGSVKRMIGNGMRKQASQQMQKRAYANEMYKRAYANEMYKRAYANEMYKRAYVGEMQKRAHLNGLYKRAYVNKMQKLGMPASIMRLLGKQAPKAKVLPKILKSLAAAAGIGGLGYAGYKNQDEISDVLSGLFGDSPPRKKPFVPDPDRPPHHISGNPEGVRPVRPGGPPPFSAMPPIVGEESDIEGIRAQIVKYLENNNESLTQDEIDALKEYGF